MRLAVVLLPALLAASGASAAPTARRVALLVERGDALEPAAVRELSAAARGVAELRVFALAPEESLDPIEKGKLLAALQARDLVVAVGDGAAEFVSEELEDIPVHFVGAGLAPGSQLASPGVSGLLSYSVEELLDAVKRVRPGTLGVASTPGYEPVVAWIRAGAAERGMDVVERRVAAPRELVPAIRGLIGKARSIWVVGDPLLARGAGFEFIRERTLSEGVPVIAAGPREVRRGALLGYQPDPEGLAAHAGRTLRRLLQEGLPPADRVQPAPRGGKVVYNEALAGKWGITVPSGTGWRPLR